jgi:hypothetical protein
LTKKRKSKNEKYGICRHIILEIAVLIIGIIDNIKNQVE